MKELFVYVFRYEQTVKLMDWYTAHDRAVHDYIIVL